MERLMASGMGALAILAMGVCSTARAQTAAAFPGSTLTVSAVGEVKLAPDMATLSVGVENTAPTAAEAMSVNAAHMRQVLAALKDAGVAERDIQTAQLDLSPQYDYEPKQPPRLTGYQASNRVQVVDHDLARLGRVIDAVTGAGATNVGQISFGIADPSGAEDQARVAAVRLLEHKAGIYAEAAGYHVGRLISLSEGSGFSPSPPRPMALMAARAEPGVPVASGRVDVRVEVAGAFELTR